MHWDAGLFARIEKKKNLFQPEFIVAVEVEVVECNPDQATPLSSVR